MASLQQQAAGAGKTQAGIERRRLAAAARRPQHVQTLLGRGLPPAIFMTDPRRTPDPLAIAARLPSGWGVIYRHFGAANRFEIGTALARVCRLRRLVLLVSADPELARSIGADGIHWPQARLHQRRRAPPGSRKLIETASAHSRGALIAAARSGVDAAIVSSVFASHSGTASAPMGVLRFREMARTSPLPVYALGGVNADTAARITRGAQTQIAGWAAVDAIQAAWGQAAWGQAAWGLRVWGKSED